MNTDSLWFGMVRRGESIRELKERVQKPLPDFLQNIHEAKSLQADFSPKKETQLTQNNQNLRQKTTMGRWGIIFVILGLITMVIGFFFGGVFYAYLKPLNFQSIPSGYIQKEPKPLWMVGQSEIKDIPVSPLKPGNPYAQRQSQLLSNSSIILSDESKRQDLWAQSQRQSSLALQSQTRSLANHAISNVSQGIKGVLGQTIGRVVEPLTAGVARRIVNNTFQATRITGSGVSEPPVPSTQKKVTEVLKKDNPLPAERKNYLPITSPLREPVTVKTSPLSSTDKNGPAKGGYALHIHTFETGLEAENAVSELKNINFSNSYVLQGIEDGQKGFQVYVGPYDHYQDAHIARKRLPFPVRIVTQSSRQ